MATLLFNRPARGIIQSSPILFDSKNSDPTAHVNRQLHANEDLDTHTNIPFQLIGPTVVVQCKDEGQSTHATTVGHIFDDHKSRS